MAEKPKWEYRVVSIGSVWRSPKNEDLEAALNEFAAEGWEIASAVQYQHTNKVMVILKRELTTSVRRQRSWPE